MPNYKYRDWLNSGSTLPFKTWCGRHRRIVANESMRKMGVRIPAAHHVHYVRLTMIPVPPTVRSLATLTREDDCAWIRSKRMADALVETDRSLGGTGSSLEFEFQSCLVCRRIMIGAEATAYRERRRWPAHKWYWPWGPCCNASCKPDHDRMQSAIAAKQTRLDRNREEWSA